MVDSLHGDFGLPCSALDALKSVFRQYPYVEGLIIYGSRVKGNYRLGSDIDLCIEGPLFSTTDLLKIENQIDDMLLPWKVDLSLLHHIQNKALLKHIKEVGIRIVFR